MRLAVIALAAWAIGVLCALGYNSASGYEYAHAGEFPGTATRWDALVAKARSQGWLSADGANLQVRVESAAGA